MDNLMEGVEQHTFRRQTTVSIYNNESSVIISVLFDLCEKFCIK
jgi:hypothetical protein